MTGITEGRLPLKIASQWLSGMLKRLKTIALIINAKPTLTKTLEAGEGAHHVAYTKDGRYAYVQNSFINLPGMSEGSITVIDMQKKEVIDTIDTFIENGFNPNCMVLLPEWNAMMGH